MNWEYVQVWAYNGKSTNVRIYTGVDDDFAFMAKLNELGSQGWELVNSDDKMCKAILKRKK